MKHLDGIRWEIFVYTYLLISRLFSLCILHNLLIFLISIILIIINLKLLHCNIDYIGYLWFGSRECEQWCSNFHIGVNFEFMGSECPQQWEAGIRRWNKFQHYWGICCLTSFCIFTHVSLYWQHWWEHLLDMYQLYGALVTYKALIYQFPSLL